MRCSCRECGVYMIQEEYGLESGCKCPNCGAMCHDCMGSKQQPLPAEALKELFVLGMFQGTNEADKTEKEDDTPEDMQNWRKYL